LTFGFSVLDFTPVLEFCLGLGFGFGFGLDLVFGLGVDLDLDLVLDLSLLSVTDDLDLLLFEEFLEVDEGVRSRVLELLVVERFPLELVTDTALFRWGAALVSRRAVPWFPQTPSFFGGPLLFHGTLYQGTVLAATGTTQTPSFFFGGEPRYSAP